MAESELPLEGVTVIDCSSVYAGPMAAQILGDLGAEVIKIEHPEFGDSVRDHGQHEKPLAFKWLNRNKKSIGVDLHAPEGQAIVEELVEDADVFIENFRPGTLERWNVGWDRLSSINPNLVMVRVTGFGQTGPYSGRPGFGTLAEAMSGFSYVTGQPDGPPTLPSLGLADFICGTFAGYAAMVALYWRDLKDGHGQYIDLSLVEPLFSFMGAHVVDYSQLGIVHERQGNRAHTSSPRNTYLTADDRWVAIAGATDGTAQRIMKIVGGEDVLEDKRFADMSARIENDEAVDELVQEWVGARTRDEVVEIFEEHEGAAAPVYSIDEIMADPHIQQRGTVISVWDDELEEDLEMPGVVPRFSETPGDVAWTGPPLGAHTRELLSDRTSIGGAEIDRLADEGIIATNE